VKPPPTTTGPPIVYVALRCYSVLAGIKRAIIISIVRSITRSGRTGRHVGQRPSLARPAAPPAASTHQRAAPSESAN